MKKLHLLFIMIICSVAMQAQITSNFLVQSYNPCTVNNVPITVTFLDLSISTNGNITNWLWDFGDGTTSTIISPLHTYSFPGNYTVCLTVENVNGDTDTECKTDFISFANTPVSIIAPPPAITCINSTAIILDGSASTFGVNISYEWTDDNFQVLGNSPTLQVSTAGSYTLVVTETTAGCSAQSTVTVTGSTNIPTAAASVTGALDCNNSSVILDGTGSSTGPNFTYTWSNTSGSIVGTSLNVEVFQPGTYTLIVTDGTNSCTSSDQVVVSENVPTYSLSPNQVFCNNQSVQIDAAGCVNCSISVTDTFGIDQCAATFPCMLFPNNGPFIVTVTDINSTCTLVDTITIASTAPIEITTSTITDVSCYGDADGAIDIEVIGGTPPYQYDWSPLFTTQDLVNLVAGNYAVTITDINGCQLVENFTVLEPSEILISDVVIVDASCFGSFDGYIDITVSGGVTPFTFFWSNGLASEDATGLSPGTYSVTIVDANNCTVVGDNYTVDQDVNIIQSMTGDTTICQGDMASLNVFAPSAVSYSWLPTTGINDPTISNPIVSPPETTTYTVTTTDASGCSEIGIVTVNIQSYLDFGLLQFSNSPICADSTLEFYANLGVQFNWTGPNGFSSNVENPIIPNATETESGIYSLTITDDIGCTATADVDVFVDDDCVYPGDTDTSMVVNHFDLLNIGLAYDSMGTTRQNASLNWIGQPSLDWSQSTPNTGVNFKHIDTDGNGVINSDDTLAITQNFGQTYNFNGQQILNQFNDLPNSTDGALTVPFYVEPDTLLEGETVSLDIILGDVSNVVTGLYGIGFSLEYDSSIVVPGTAKIDFTNTWLGSVNADAISVQFDFPSPGRIDAAITRIDGAEMDGFGLFGEFIITLEDDILLWDPNKDPENENTVDAEFSITNYHLINFSEEEIPVQGMTTIATIDEVTSLSQIELEKLIEVYPNPANGLFFITSKDLEIEQVRIYSAAGNLHQVKTIANRQVEFSTENLSNGIYFIEIQTREGIVIKKLSVVK